MFIGGALAGIAGAGQVCGVTQRFVMDINPGYGFTGIIVALMGRLTPVGVVFSAFFVGALINGSYNMETVTGIPNALIDSIQGIILVSVISAQVISTYQIRRVSER
jgi:simple sugar transport system permease protein